MHTASSVIRLQCRMLLSMLKMRIHIDKQTTNNIYESADGLDHQGPTDEMWLVVVTALVWPGNRETDLAYTSMV